VDNLCKTCGTRRGHLLTVDVTLWNSPFGAATFPYRTPNNPQSINTLRDCSSASSRARGEVTNTFHIGYDF
jgi:hypothetical protein